MQKLNELDKMRLQLLRKVVEDYFAGATPIEDVSYAVESLISRIEGLSPERKQELFHNWTILEEVYAYMLFQDRETLLPNEQSLFNEALQAIDAKAEEYLH